MTISNKIRRDASNRMLSSFGGEIIYFITEKQREAWENKVRKAKDNILINLSLCGSAISGNNLN